VKALLGPELINARIMGAIERLVLAGCLYFWLTRYFKVGIAFISTTACIFMLGANNVDLVYSFWQTQLVFGIGTGVFISLALATAHGRRQLGYLFVAGLCAGLAFMTKQTAIMFLFLPVAFLLVVSTDRFRDAVRVKRSSVLAFVAGWATVVLAILLWLAANGALVPFIGQVFGGVSSKGSLTSIVFGFLTRAFPRRDVAWFLRLALLGLPLVALAKQRTDAPGAPRWLELDGNYTLLLGIAVAASVIVPYLSVPLSNSLTKAYAFWIRWPLVNGVFYFSIGLVLIYSIRLFTRNPAPEDVQLGLLALFSLAVVFEDGTCSGIDEGAVMPGLAVALAVILSRLSGSTYAKALKVAVYAGAVLLVALCVSFKYVAPYKWWGVGEPDIRTATVAPKAPLLRGLRISPSTEALVRGVTDAIEANSSPSDYIFTFPDIPIFYLLSRRDPPTFAPVHYWDVCPDWCATDDAERLLENPPAVIVNMEFPERAQRAHEKMFRNGRPSGQRRMIEAMNELIQTYNYRLVEDYPNPTGYPIQVWAKPKAGG
jgi:hypothetical protein